MSNGIEVSAAVSVGGGLFDSDASLTVGVGFGGVATKLAIKTESFRGDQEPEASPNKSSEKPESSPEESSENRPEASPEESSENRPEASPEESSENRPEASPEESSEKHEASPEKSSEKKPEASPEERSEKPETSPEESSEKPEASPEKSSEKKPEASPEESSEKRDASPEESSEKQREALPDKSSGEPEASTDKSSKKAAGHDEAPDSGRGFRIFGIEFAPLNTPMRRRLQTLAVMQWLLSITILPVVCVLFIMLTLFTPLAPISLAYIGWILVFDRNTSQRGGRRLDWVRRWSLWRHYRDYFPIRLVKSADLDPAHNYLIGYHPHGIISCGAFCNFGTEATGFSAKFPGIKPYLLTLRLNFFWPLLRGYFMSAGLCDVSRSSLRWILNREGGGNAAIIVVGGAQEALDARPGNYKLTLLRRKGFARMALQTGAHLVPCFSFGENDLFRQAANPPGSRVRAFQQLFKGAMGSSPPLFYGRGIFNYTIGLLPFRHSVTTVVGAPIPVEKCAEPTQEQVEQLHLLYMDRLAQLFDEHKGEHGVPEDVRLEFV